MHQATVTLPAKMDLQSILGFSRELDYYAAHENLTVDFGESLFHSPYSLLFIASKLRSFRVQNAELKFDFRHVRENHYPAHMGFFSMFGVDHGREIGERGTGQNFIPITEIHRSQFYEAPIDQFSELPDLIQRTADRIAEMISQSGDNKSTMFDALSYSIREVMRNVFEHSEADSLYYCAQYWPKSNKVEFAISDFGVGIRRGLAENPNFRFKTDKEAIEYSMLPSVSGKTHLPRRSETWFNSGYGLYMTSRLARHGGNFVLASRSMAVHLSRMTKNNYPTSFPGTALRFNFDINEIGSVSTRLDQFRREGSELARTIAGTGNRPPSAMSLLLRRDFAPR